MSKKEARALQRRLRLINRNGGYIGVEFPDGLKTEGVIDSIIVVGVEGEVVDALWIESWFDEPQHIHRSRFLKFKPDEAATDPHDGEQWLEVEMEDDLGRKYRLEMIVKEIEPGKHAAWKKWQEYKNENAERFKLAEKQILESYPDIRYILG